ncbi:hypothetical protein BH23ACT12_BH23ACT12_01510 [soil metagenome]
MALSPKSVPSNPWGLCDRSDAQRLYYLWAAPDCGPPTRFRPWDEQLKDPLPVPGIARDTRKLPAGAANGQGPGARFIPVLTCPKIDAGPEVPRVVLRCALPRTQLRTSLRHLGPCVSHTFKIDPATTIPSTQCLPAQIPVVVGKNLQGRETNEDSLCSLKDRFAARGLADCVRLRQVTQCVGGRQGRFRTIVRDPKGFFPLHIEDGEQSSLRVPAVYRSCSSPADRSHAKSPEEQTASLPILSERR